MRKHCALLFLDKLFKNREYNLDTKNIQQLKGGSMCKIIIENDVNAIIMCLIIINDEHVNEFQTIFEDVNLNDTSSKKKTFIKNIIQHGKECKAKEIILISDSIQSQAINDISNSCIRITHFSFLETNCAKIVRHVNQPLYFKKLNIEETKKFKKENPRYKQELQIIGHSDALIKFCGYKIGDIVSVIEFDPNVGPQQQYALVVQNLEPKEKKPKEKKKKN
jgi:DNA-directed RNA polymerase subunit H (RpoH/RPB5)